MADEDDGEPRKALSFRERRLLASTVRTSTTCPYLSQVDRRKLDFDMAPVCSLTLSPHNVYACLVCGHFFGGRGSATPAFAHAVEAGHHVWVGLTPPEGVTEGVGEGSWRPRFWCLPDDYEVLDASLEDIGAAIRPKFTAAQLAALDASPAMALDAADTPFLPGYLGVNNLGHTDGMLSLVLALAHVTPLRNYFLAEPPPYAHAREPLVHRFADLLRRLWASRALRATISPHAFVNAVSNASNRKFSAGAPIDATAFLPWLLNALHKALVEVQAPVVAAGDSSSSSSSSSAAAAAAAPVQAGIKRPRPAAQPPHAAAATAAAAAAAASESIISHVFAGEVEITLLASGLEDAKRKEAAAAAAAGKGKGRRQRSVEGMGGGEEEEEEEEEQDQEQEKAAQQREAGRQAAASSSRPGAPASLPHVTRRPFLFLTLDLPPMPLFTDARGGIKIPQVPVYELLQRFDGVCVTETLQGQHWEKRRYRLTRLPRVLALLFKRFSHNAFFAEKNATIVTCPTRSLELEPFVEPAALARARAAAAAALAAAPPAPPPLQLPLPADIPSMPTPALKALLLALRAFPPPSQAAGMEKADLVRLAAAAVAAARAAGSSSDAGAPPQPQQLLLPPAALAAVTKFDLVASVVHEVASNTESGGLGAAGDGKGKGRGGGGGGGGGGGAHASAAPPPPSSSSSSSSSSSADAMLSTAAAAVRSTASASDPLHRGAYKVHLLGPSAAGRQQQQWYEIGDLAVTEILAQQVGVSESCLLFYARRDTGADA